MSKTTYKTNGYLSSKTLQNIRLTVARRTKFKNNKAKEVKNGS